jgi:hypothetical protein
MDKKLNELLCAAIQNITDIIEYKDETPKMVSLKLAAVAFMFAIGDDFMGIKGKRDS